ncbi:hypothetical protein [Streptococcus gordonii]
MGSVVRLKDGSQELMILSRAPLIEEIRLSLDHYHLSGKISC